MTSGQNVVYAVRAGPEDTSPPVPHEVHPIPSDPIGSRRTQEPLNDISPQVPTGWVTSPGSTTCTAFNYTQLYLKPPPSSSRTTGGLQRPPSKASRTRSPTWQRAESLLNYGGLCSFYGFLETGFLLMLENCGVQFFQVRCKKVKLRSRPQALLSKFTLSH